MIFLKLYLNPGVHCRIPVFLCLNFKKGIKFMKYKVLKSCWATVMMSAKQVFDGNILTISGEYFIKFMQFIMFTLIWKSLIKDGKSFDGAELSQILTYSLMASILKPQLDIVTPATSALWEGSIIGRYTRPISVIGSLIAETIGRYWIPVFLFYGLPLWLLSPLLGINPFPASFFNGIMAFVSLLLSISLGFALDLLFASFAIRLKNGCWAATRARESIYSLLSGALIPFIFFPWGLGKVFRLLPFGSIGNAPLTIYTGIESEIMLIVGVQMFWNVILWIAGIKIFKKSEERMISFGG